MGIIPALISYLTVRKNLSATSANLIGLKISNILLILGLILVSFSAELWMLGVCTYFKLITGNQQTSDLSASTYYPISWVRREFVYTIYYQ